MKANFATVRMEAVKTRLSTVWIFLVLNYLYCDLFGLMDVNLLKQYLTGRVAGIELTQGFLMAASVLMELPMLMVLLSRMLEYRFNRWAHIVAGTLMAAVQVGSLFIDSPTLYYIFFSAIEITALAYVVWYAWQWRE